MDTASASRAWAGLAAPSLAVVLIIVAAAIVNLAALSAGSA